MKKLNVFCCCCPAKPKNFLRAALSILILFSASSIILTGIILFSFKPFRSWSILNAIIIPADIAVLMATFFLNCKNKSRGLKDYLIKTKVGHFVCAFLAVYVFKTIVFFGFAGFSTISLFIVESYHQLYVNPDVVTNR